MRGIVFAIILILFGNGDLPIPNDLSY